MPLMARPHLRSTLVVTALLTACGLDTGPGISGSDASSGSDSTAAVDTTTPATTSVTAATGDGGSSGSTTAATTESVDDTTGTTTGEPPWEGEPLPDTEVGQWQWFDIEGTECIDGSPTGLGLRRGSGDGLVVYFEGGGGCFDFASCSLYYLSFANFDQNAFELLVPTLLSTGIFDAEDPDNPVADWSFVYVPYCTGDVHAGDRDLGGVPGFGGAHQFVGYRNFGLDLERIGPTIAEPSQVLVTGISAGGYGAALNYDRIAQAYAYADVPITLLDDSGPPMGESIITPCLQELWRDLWGLDDTLPLGCADCFDDRGWVVDLTLYIQQQYPEQSFGLISYLQDGTISTFMSAGDNDCAGGIVFGPEYEAALIELRDVILADADNWATYYVTGIGHTFLPFGSYASTQVQGVGLRDWVGDVLAGTATHVSP